MIDFAPAGQAPAPRRNIRRILTVTALLGASAAASVAAQSVPGAAGLSLAALGPLFFLLSSSGFLSSWLLIASFNVLSATACAFWIRHAEGGVPSLVALAALAAALAAIPAAGTWLAGPLRCHRLLPLVPCWMLMDRAAALTPLDYLWTGLGTPLADWAVAAQAAALAGPEALSLLAAGGGVGLALLARGMPLAALAQGPAWLALALAFGWWRLPPPQAGGSLVALVQPAIPQDAGWDRPESRTRLLRDLSTLIDRAAALRPELIVLPEAALPGLVRFDEELAAFARAAVERTARPLLFGSIDRDEAGLYNAAFLISPDGNVSVYRKARLAPWVEAGRFARGGRALFPYLAGATMAPALWEEDASADWLRESGQAGADMAVAMFNSVAFASPAETLIHRRKAQLAAAAAGMPLLRVANHAGSGSVDAFGRIRAQAAPGRPAVVAARVVPGRLRTWFGAFGGWCAPAAAGMWILALWLGPRLAPFLRAAAPRRRRRRTPRPPDPQPGGASRPHLASARS